HIQKGIWIPLLIQIGSFVNGKSHVFIKTNGLGILLIDRYPFYLFITLCPFQQLLSQSFSTFRRRNEQHLHSPFFRSVKRHRLACFCCHIQTCHPFYGLGHIRLNAVYLIIRQKQMGCSDRILPHRQQLLHQHGRSFLYFHDFHIVLRHSLHEKRNRSMVPFSTLYHSFSAASKISSADFL